jgi:arginyl-tRNA synthetase
MEDIKERAEENLIKRLSQFPMFIQTITEELSPSLLASYARDLADDFNEFYRDVPVLSAEKERETRIAEVEASRIVLKNVLELLGIEPLQEM